MAKPEISAAPTKNPRLRCADRNLEVPRPPRIDALISSEHRARVVWEFVDGLDLSPLHAEIRAVEGEPGSPAIDPKILMAVWLYAILDGETSARRIADFCREHSAYIWLCGGVNVNHHTLSDFFVGHEDYLQEQFTLHLAVLMNEGVVDAERVAQDGMRIRASAGAASFRRKETLEECLEEAEKRMEDLRQARKENPAKEDKRRRAARERAARERSERVKEALKQLPDVEAKKKEKDKTKARVSTTDPDARVMKMGDGGFRPAYNAQLSTDTQTQIIVGVEVVNEGADQGQLSPMLEQVKERIGEFPAEVLVDGGFATKKEIDTVTDAGVDVYAPVPKPKKEERDRHEPMPGDSEAVADWRKRMGTDEAKEIYRERASTAECVNAIARNRGLLKFTVRGLPKVKVALLWFAIAHNVMRAAVLRPNAA